jgi:iron complex outermembrane receptor protein
MRIYRRPFAQGGLGLTCLLATAVAAGQEESKSGARSTPGAPIAFNIPYEPLSRALQDFAAQSHLQLVYQTGDLDSAQPSSPLQGTYTPEAALERLLLDTHLHYVFLNAKTVSITTTSASRRFASPGAEGPPGGLNSVNMAYSYATTPSGNNGGISESQGASASEGELSSPEEPLAEVTITGSHIRGLTNKTNPVIVIDQAAIQRSGYSSTQDLFRSLSQNFTSGDASEDGAFSGNGKAGTNLEGASGVNLRGLGVASTLVLVNGHRIAPSVFGSVVDVSLIPLSAIDHIEILTDGSSAIYGSDAVGGVVNIILKRNSEGADTSVRFGSVAQGHRDDELFAQTVGSTWSSGNVVGTLQYQRQAALSASDRDFSSTLTMPNDLLPDTQTYSTVLDGREDISPQLHLTGDLLLTKKHFGRDASDPHGTGVENLQTSGNTSNVSITPGLRYEFAPKWSLDLNTLFGRARASSLQAQQELQVEDQTSWTTTEFTEKSADLVLSGLWSASTAGDVGVALGGGYRSERAKTFTALTDMTTGARRSSSARTTDRNVKSVYGEVYIPLVGPANRVASLNSLAISGALRNDNYSDFGSKITPRVGLVWSPWSEISIRGSYGRSFRAPDPQEIGLEASKYILAEPFTSPSGTGKTPVFVLIGGKLLEPEEARTSDFGVDYTPPAIPGLKVGLNYYKINFKNRITTPPFNTTALLQQNVYGQFITPIASDAAAQSVLSSAISGGAQFFDLTGGSGATGVRYVVDFRQQNAAVVRQSGLDLTSAYGHSFGAYSFTSTLNASYIDKIETAFASSAPYLDLVNTVGNPPKWRGRFETEVASNRWSLGAALNLVGSYRNNLVVGYPSVASWTTLDLSGRLKLDSLLRDPAWKGVSMTLSVLNALDRDPPYVDAPSLIRVNYDPTNANPLNRLIALELRKTW